MKMLFKPKTLRMHSSRLGECYEDNCLFFFVCLFFVCFFFFAGKHPVCTHYNCSMRTHKISFDAKKTKKKRVCVCVLCVLCVCV